MNDSRTWARRLVHKNIQATTITFSYIESHQGFECYHVEEKLN